MPGPPFVHLHVHSQYSLLDGVTHFGPLFERVKELGMDTIALTDHGNLFGAVAFFKAAQAANIKPIIGCEVYLSPTEYTDRTTPEGKRTQQHLVLLAKDFQGYLNLCYLVSKGYLEGFYRRPRIDRKLLAEKSEGLVALSGCLSGVVADYLKNGREKDALQAADEYKQIMGPDHFYIELMDHGMPEQKTVNAQLIDVAKKTGLPLVATNDSHYLRPEDAKTQDLLLAIGTGKTLADATRLKFDSEEFYLKSSVEMERLFGEVEGSLSNTVKIAEMCNPEIRFRQSLLPVFDCPGGMDPEKYLRQLVEQGLNERYGEMTDPIRERYEHEMHIITSMGFVSYFLVVWDFVNYARRENIPTGCRGSGAGSIVAYALRITELDPIGSKLFFERFLNPERVSMPDFDIDICQARRGEVIQYVRDKYGDENVANIITFGKMKAKAAVRDVGRVMDLPLGTVDRVAKLIPDGPKATLDKAFEESPDFKALYDADPQIKSMIDRAKRIEGTVRQPGMHAAGVVVCSKPLIDAVPLYRQSGQGDAITQFDMIEVEELGLLKIDFLGLKNLTMIAQAVQLIKEDHDVDIDWNEVGFDDDDTFALLQRGDGFGVFQVESSGMREMLRRALPSNFEDIVALIALYRPGPLQFMDTFINRKHGREEITYPHPLLEAPLEDTYGLMIYQEQVMQVASLLAGFSLGQADLLRRAMSKKKAKDMAKMKKQFMAGSGKKGIDPAVAEEVFAMIEKFASYGFNKAHAASYAVLTFRTAWLKAHYPTEFMAALLTSEIRTGASDKLGMYVGVTRDMGVEVKPPDINESQMFFSTDGPDIRFGLAAIKNVGQGPVSEILRAREDGPFQSFQDFCERVDATKVGSRAVECLITCGAFDRMEGTRPQLIAIMAEALELGAASRREKESGQTSLFEALEDTADAQSLNQIPLPELPDWPDREKFNREKELAGIFLSGHPLDRFRADARSFADTASTDLPDLQPDQFVRMVGMITACREITTKKGDPMAFVELEDFEGKYEVVVFPRTYEECKYTLTIDQMLYIEGKYSIREGEDEGKVLVNKAEALENVRRARAKFIDIEMPADAVDIQHLESMRKLFRTYQGKVPIRLMLNGGDREKVIIQADNRFRINPTDEFLAALEKLDFPKTMRLAQK